MTALHSEKLAPQTAASSNARAPLVILHGMLGSGTNWRSMARRLSAERLVYLLDARNHGRSAHAPTMDYPSMARDVAEWLAANSLDRAVLLGHSMGGKTAMRLCLDAPSSIIGSIVVDIAPIAYAHTEHEPLLRAMQALPLDSISSRAQADSTLATAVPDAALRAFLLHNLMTENGGLRWRINLPVILQHLTDLIDFPVGENAQYGGDTLFIRGANSEYVAEEHWPRIEVLFPNARLQTIAAAGHWVHAEQPDAFFQQVSQFLMELDRC